MVELIDEQLERYLAEDPGGPVVMLNLLRFKPRSGGREPLTSGVRRRRWRRVDADATASSWSTSARGRHAARGAEPRGEEWDAVGAACAIRAGRRSPTWCARPSTALVDTCRHATDMIEAILARAAPARDARGARATVRRLEGRSRARAGGCRCGGAACRPRRYGLARGRSRRRPRRAPPRARSPRARTRTGARSRAAGRRSRPPGRRARRPRGSSRRARPPDRPRDALAEALVAFLEHRPQLRLLAADGGDPQAQEGAGVLRAARSASPGSARHRDHALAPRHAAGSGAKRAWTVLATAAISAWRVPNWWLTMPRE